MGIVDTPIRFFIPATYDDDGQEFIDGTDYKECEEADFLEAEGVIEYERFTILDNGCKQIYLTKNPFTG